MTSVILTREQLYELVWSKPMTAIAKDFGVSSVAFAKNCEKLNVPRPPRGYWQKLAQGLRPEQESLPARSGETPDTIELKRYERAAVLTRPAERPAHIGVPPSLVDPHPMVKRLTKELREFRAYGAGLRSVRGRGHSVLKVSKGEEDRALRILDTLCKALVERGHDVHFGPHAKDSREFALEAVVREQKVEFWLGERLAQSAHVETAEEKTMSARVGWSWASKFDHKPSGELTLEIKVPWNTRTRHRWRDSERQALEERLGDVLAGFEAAADAWHEEGRRQELDRVAREEAERKRRRQALYDAHYDALEKDLVAMASAYDEANRVRLFLERVKASAPEQVRSPAFVAWLQWALEYATELDPLSRPDEIAKTLEPDSSKLTDPWRRFD